MHLNADELEALQLCTGYIAGFVNLEESNRPDLYDVLVNLAESEITIAPLAKEAMAMAKLHKEMGQLIVQSAEDPEKSDSQVIQVTPSPSDLLEVLTRCRWVVCGRGVHISRVGGCGRGQRAGA